MAWITGVCIYFVMLLFIFNFNFKVYFYTISPTNPVSYLPSPIFLEMSFDKGKKSAPAFRPFQCFVCNFFTAEFCAFQLHLASTLHSSKCGHKVVCCASGSCYFRSSKPDKILLHLQEKNYHRLSSTGLADEEEEEEEEDVQQPICLLTLGPLASLLAEDSDDMRNEQDTIK